MPNKRYFWMKLKEDFFKQPKIKKLRKLAGGDTFTIIYLKMQLLSIKNNGIIFFENIEKDMISELALILDEEKENIDLTVAYLSNHNLIEINNNFDFKMVETQTLIGSESSSAKRVRKHRLNQLNLQKTLQCNKNVTTDKEIDIDIDKEIDIDIDKEIEKDKDKNNKFISSKSNKKIKFGEYEHVLLTYEQLSKLNEDYSKEIIDKAIKKLDEYIQESGKKYKDHNLTLRRWVIDSVIKENKVNKKDLREKILNTESEIETNKNDIDYNIDEIMKRLL